MANFDDQEGAKTLMRRGSRKMWWVVVPCTRKKSKQTESRMDIEEILKMKLATITEEPETIEENGGLLTSKHRSLSSSSSSSSCMTKMGKKKNHLIKVKMGRLFMPQFSLKESYLIFMTGLALKGGLHGLPRC